MSSSSFSSEVASLTPEELASMFDEVIASQNLGQTTAQVAAQLIGQQANNTTSQSDSSEEADVAVSAS